MKTISSAENRIYKLCRQLAQKKYRDKSGCFIIEGENAVEEAVCAGQDIELIVVRSDYQAKIDLSGHDAVFMEGRLFSKAAQTETSQGILAIVHRPELTEADFIERIGEKSGNVIVLDRLQDPGNIGTIIRTADAAGYRGVLTIKGTGDVYSPKVVRAAAGSLFRIPVLCADSPDAAVKLLAKAGKTIVSTGFDTETYYYDVDLSENIGLIIGNEGEGVSPELMQVSQVKIKIPMKGEVDSLNAAVAAGILMYSGKK